MIIRKNIFIFYHLVSAYILLRPLVQAYILATFAYLFAAVVILFDVAGFANIADFEKHSLLLEKPAFFVPNLAVCLFVIRTFFESIQDRSFDLEYGRVEFDVHIRRIVDFCKRRILITKLLGALAV